MTADADPSSRRRLLHAAIEAFGTRGYKGTTTRDIALAAGMSPAAIYVHHRSKEDLLFVVCEAGHLELLAEVEKAISRGNNPRDRLAGVMRAFVVEHALNPPTARVVNDEVDSLEPEHRRHIITLRRRLDGHVRGIVEEGLAAGVFHTPDASMATRALLSLGMDVARWFLPGGRWSVDEIADSYSEFALAMVGAEAPRDK